MGIRWEERITYFTKKWNREDSEDFLVFLQNRIGTEDTIKRIKSPSYLHTINYKQFRKRVSLYEEYIGEAGVTLRLRRSLGGFDRGKISEIRVVIKYMEDYIGPEATKDRMKENVRGFSQAKLSELKKVMKYVEDYIGPEATKDKIKENLEAFSRAKLSKLQKIVKYVENYIGVEATKEKMKRDLQGFSKLKMSKLKQWEKEWDVEILKERLEKYNLQSLLEWYGNP